MAGRNSMGSQYFTSVSDRPFDDKAPDTDNFASIISSLRRILQTTAQTSEEKFKILEERDKLYKIMKDKDPTFKKGALIATCPDMCPEKERLLRDYQGRGSMFEMTNYSKTSTFNHSLAVKEYARSSADQEEPLPHDLRPINVLMMTMSHLLHNVADYCELSDDNLEEWYMFMWDRTRAIRKELTQQRLCSLESVTLVEQCARFHIHCAERLINQSSSIYDDKINTENLTKCLQTLKYMYKDLAKEDINCPNEPEFICYSLLLNLNNSSVFTELSDMSSTLMASEAVKFALDVMAAWEAKNYIRFFNLVKNTTYLNCCLLRRYFGEMRLYAIKTMIRSFCTKTYSPQILISRFVEMLNFDGEEECLNFLSYCNFNFFDLEGKRAVNFDRINFQNPNTAIPPERAFLFIEEKKRRPLSEIIAGESEPPALYQVSIRQNSFTPSGELDPELAPQKELISFFLKDAPPVRTSPDIKTDYNKSANEDIFPKVGSVESSEESKLQNKEAGIYSSSPFEFKKENVQPSVFDEVQAFGQFGESSSTFGNTVGNVFDTPGENNFSKNKFEKQRSTPVFSSNTDLFSNLNPKIYPAVVAQEKQVASSSAYSGSLIHFLPEAVAEANLEEDEEEEELKEYFERERIKREKEEELKRQNEEEERLKILLEKKREEEKRELERKERERREEEERQKKEELARREREERIRKEEEELRERLREAAERQLAELKEQEERERKIELEHKAKVENVMKDLKTKMRKWKAKIVLDKWRVNTFAKIEGQKMEKYFKEMKLRYPPVCTEEMLGGNPHGLVIPSVLNLEKVRNWNKESSQEHSEKKMVIVNDDLPLLKMDRILGKIFEEQAESPAFKSNPFFWKLVISVPDQMESENSKSIETFVEMHFVDDPHWKFGAKKGPLYFRSCCRGPFRYNICIRRLRNLCEGTIFNPAATTGSNALIFLEDGNPLASERLKTVLESRHPLPKIPVIILPLNPDAKQNLDKLLEMETTMQSYISKMCVVPVNYQKCNFVAELIKSMRLAVVHSAPPTSLTVAKFSKFLCEIWFDRIWRRVEFGLSNYKIILRDPKILIEFYNSCLDKLTQAFVDEKSLSEHTVLAPEFSGSDLNPSIRVFFFEEELKELLNKLKLPNWPDDTSRSTPHLKYRIHLYCLKVCDQDELKNRNLKWSLYRIIRQPLLSNGLDINRDEDINKILSSFPWMQVFQEISKTLAGHVCKKLRDCEDFIVTYDAEQIDKFSFESSFIGKFFEKSGDPCKKQQSLAGEGESEDLSPRPENDSIIYAYKAAIERETNKRKREESCKESLDELFSSPAMKRLTSAEDATSSEVARMRANFSNMENQLDEIKKQLAKNFETLTNLYKELK